MILVQFSAIELSCRSTFDIWDIWEWDESMSRSPELKDLFDVRIRDCSGVVLSELGGNFGLLLSGFATVFFTEMRSFWDGTGVSFLWLFLKLI